MSSRMIFTDKTPKHFPEIYLNTVTVAEDDSRVCPICGENTQGRFVNLTVYEGRAGNKPAGRIKPYIYFCECCSRYTLQASGAKNIIESLVDAHFKILNPEDPALCTSSHKNVDAHQSDHLAHRQEQVADLSLRDHEQTAEAELHRIGYNITNKTADERQNVLRLAIGRLSKDEVLAHLNWLLSYGSAVPGKHNGPPCLEKLAHDIEWINENF